MRILFSIGIENTDQNSMPDQHQTDLMIARLEKANARAYEQLARSDERVLKSEQHSLDQDDPSSAPKRQSPRARPLFVALIGLLLAASACVTAFTWEPSYVAAKLIFARWANASVSQTLPEARTMPHDNAPAAPLISPETARPLQRMADDLANVEKQIEQLKASQEQIIRRDQAIAEQFNTSQQQMARDNTKVVEQLNAALAEAARHNAAVAEQLKTSQERLAEVWSSRAAGSTRKFLRRLSSLQKRAQTQRPIRLQSSRASN
jgi:hypothetical protein